MPLEIEAKMRLDDTPAMISLLRAQGAACVGEFLETNTFYDTEDRSLLSRGSGLRLRIARDMASGHERYVLTHKGPLMPGELKVRPESELEVANAEDADRLLAQLGFVRQLRFQKRRHSWTLEDCHIELDCLPALGGYIEIEGPSEASVIRMRAKLGLSGEALIRTGYASLVSEHLEARGICCKRELIFPHSAV